MAALAGTTWTFTIGRANGAVLGNFTMEFKADGTGIQGAPNGQKLTFYYCESPEGTFVIQMPKSTPKPELITIMTGTQKMSGGCGDYVRYEGNGFQTVLCPFSMVKK